MVLLLNDWYRYKNYTVNKKNGRYYRYKVISHETLVTAKEDFRTMTKTYEKNQFDGNLKRIKKRTSKNSAR